MYDISHLRQSEFPLSEHDIYFNHAAISPLPVRTCERMQDVVGRLSQQPATYFMEEFMQMVPRLQVRLATLINAADPLEIQTITTTSAALNAVAQAIDWEPGDNVLFCEIEFPSNAFPWMSLERYGVEVRQVPAVSGGLTLEALAPLVDDRTRLVAASAIQFFTGHRTNLDAIGAFCRERGILFVVDAIQAIGHMPFNVQQMHIDVLATGGQKSLLSAPGTGFLYVRSEVAAQMDPRAIGPNATRDFLQWLDYDLTPLPGAARFAMGTSAVTGIAGMAESLGLLEELGVANIDRHTTELAAEAIAMLERMGYEVLTPPGHGPIVTFDPDLDNEQADELVALLHQKHVTISKRQDAAHRPYIRLSFHAYNTPEELHQFEEIYREALAELE